MSAPPDKQEIYSARWYRKHRDDYLSSMHEKYHDDPEFRELRIAQAENYQSRRREGYFPNFKPLYREHNGKLVRVFRLSEVAREIGRSTHAVYQWERSGQIPPASFGRRLYTEYQAGLLQLLADAYPASNFVALRITISDFIWKKW